MTMKFPFTTPDQSSIQALEKAWRRQDLQRYLTRWSTAKLPPIPPAFFQYTKRACDMGCGIGKFIMQEGAKRPEWSFLGIDKGSIRSSKMLNRLQGDPRPNVFAMHTNAIPILASMAPESLDLLTIFYPNPWWPNKHRQKRWAFHPLLPHLCRLLRPGGSLWITSNEGFYLQEFLYAVTHHPAIENINLEYQGPIQVTEGRTHFETKFLAEGTPCGELRFTKSS